WFVLRLKPPYSVSRKVFSGEGQVAAWKSYMVCVYVNKHGNSGPHLDKKKVQQLPDHFGPGPVNVVLQQAVQACVDCAYQSKTVFGFLKSGHHGGEMITASFDGEKHAINLPSVNSASFVLRFLEKLCHSLQCDNLFSSQPFSPYMGCAHSPMDEGKMKWLVQDLPSGCLSGLVLQVPA
uniref:Uncharacterized protein n=1 Tax=Melopsittacus undulatus TaxID=13146 RepID=A0A8C6IV13_MELUD